MASSSSINDSHIDRWILEYLLHKSSSDLPLSTLLSIIPIQSSSLDSRLQKTLLLRNLESDLSCSSFTEQTLDIIEELYELDEEKSSVVSEAMRAAYCAVAVECTVIHLGTELERNKKYYNAVKRVWRVRLKEKMEGIGDSDSDGVGLVGEEMMRWKDEIEDAIWDERVCVRVLGRDTKGEATRAVRRYLDEAWAELGPPVLRMIVAKWFRDIDGDDLGKNGPRSKGPGSSGNENTCREMIVRSDVLVKCECRGKGLVQDGLGKTEVVDSDHDDGGVRGGLRNGNVEETVGVYRETKKGKIKHREKHLRACGGRFKTVGTRARGMKIANANEMDEDMWAGSANHVSHTPKFNAVRKGLKRSSMDLHNAVEDPLPNALRMAENISARMKEEHDMKVTATRVNPYVRAHLPTSQQNGRLSSDSEESEGSRGMKFTVARVNPNVRAHLPTYQQNGSLSSDSEGSEGSHGVQHAVHRGIPTKRRNLGSDAYQWDEFRYNGSSSSKRPRLSSPKSGNVSPLAFGELVVVEKYTRRRKRKMWTPLEEETLRLGVNRFGAGNWKLICNTYHDILKDRTDVDLKDKWRNMTRHEKWRSCGS